jgi:hypothetical protein
MALVLSNMTSGVRATARGIRHTIGTAAARKAPATNDMVLAMVALPQTLACAATRNVERQSLPALVRYLALPAVVLARKKPVKWAVLTRC